MLRIYFLQLGFNLSDPAVEEALDDSLAMRGFMGIDLGFEGTPEETTVCKFRLRLERNKLGKTLLKAVNDHLRRIGIKISNSAIVDATIIGAPARRRTRTANGILRCIRWRRVRSVLLDEGASGRGQQDQADPHGPGEPIRPPPGLPRFAEFLFLLRDERIHALMIDRLHLGPLRSFGSGFRGEMPHHRCGDGAQSQDPS
jgi:hypothetical protein